MLVLNIERPGWWVRHTHHAIQYVEAVGSGDREEAERHLLHLVRMLPAWEEAVSAASRNPKAGALALALMAEHLVGFKLAADGAAAGRDADVGVAVDLLKRNAEAQAELLGAAVQGLLEDEFLDLLDRHVDLASIYVSALTAGDKEGFAEGVEVAEKNAEELDDFADRNLYRR